MIKPALSEKWIKASIIGTIWAASEIVLGSFLHNLKVPFSGNVLTAIGLIMLISISYRWREKGLFWRAGLICAILKTLSPSAVIFGPMVAIFSESLLLEFFVRTLGRTIPGYLLGSIMAMTWNLFQKIANYVIFYGAGIVDVYTDLLHMAQKQLQLKTDIVWLPIIVLLIADIVFGILASLIGIRVGRKAQMVSVTPLSGTERNSFRKLDKKPVDDFKYSVLWLLADFLLIIGSLLLLSYTQWIVWSLIITGIVIIWAFRYKRALRQLSKPKFWIFFVVITLITAFVFTKAESGEDVLVKGLLAGFQMNFRAVIIILGFAVLGTELYNPKVRNFFLGTSFKNLPLALELSVESLPFFIARIPDFKTIVRNPVSVFTGFISHAENRLAEVRSKSGFQQKVFIISGSQNEGKTWLAKNLVGVFRENNIPVGGFLSEKVREGSQIIGYDLVDILTNSREILLRESDQTGGNKIGRFAIFPQGLKKGIQLLSPAQLLGKRLVIIDEVGRLELNDKGWSDGISSLMKTSKIHLLFTVRDSFTDEVIRKWSIGQPHIFKVSQTNYQECGKSIIDQMNS
jgi:nucleoside-triphosphatase THEP1